MEENKKSEMKVFMRVCVAVFGSQLATYLGTLTATQ